MAHGDQDDALALDLWKNRVAQVALALRRRSRRGLVCIARDDSCCVPRVLSSPPSHVFVLRVRVS